MYIEVKMCFYNECMGGIVAVVLNSFIYHV